MTRVKGNIELGLNIEPTGASILDARLKVATLEELYLAYPANNCYPKMLVTVEDTGDGQPGVYCLLDVEQRTSSAGWKRMDAAAASKIEVVNDLTTGGTDKALSAEQGKVLDQKITDSKSTVDNYTINGNKISTNPVLDGSNIQLSESYLEGEYSDPVIGDSIDTAIGKLAKGVKDATQSTGVTSLNDEKGAVVLSTGDTNGTFKVNSKEVAIAGLKSAAYSETSEFDAAGSANSVRTEIIGSDGDTSDKSTIYGAKKYAEEKANAAQSAAASDAQSKADEALRQAKEYTDGKDTAQTEALQAHIDNSSNPHNVTKDQVGLSNVTNDAQVKRSEMGVASGVATLDENGKIPASQLNGDLGRVVGIQKFLKTQAELSTDPDASTAKEGDKYFCEDTKKIYTKTSDGWDEGVDPKDNTLYNHRLADSQGRTNVLYRWDGSVMAEVSASLALGETQGTAYEGNKGKANADAIAKLNGEEGTEGSVAYTAKSIVDREIAALDLSNTYDAKGSADAVKAAVDKYTVNGKLISSNPTLGAGDINMSEGGSVESEVTDIKSKLLGYYKTEATSGNSITIEKSTHNCGEFPQVKCYLNGVEVGAAITLTTGNVTVSWNGSDVTELNPLQIIIIGR